MPTTDILYKITAAVDWRSTLYLQANRAQWGIFLAGTVNSTTFEITRQVAGQLPDPLIQQTWVPNYTGGLTIPGAVDTSDTFDLAIPIPVPNATQNVSYSFSKLSGRDTVTFIAPSSQNNYMAEIVVDDPDPGAGTYEVELYVQVTTLI